MPRKKNEPTILSEALREATPTTKLLWVYLWPLGWVALSQRDLADALGLHQPNVQISLASLHKAGLLAYREEPRQGAVSTYRATGAGED